MNLSNLRFAERLYDTFASGLRPLAVKLLAGTDYVTAARLRSGDSLVVEMRTTIGRSIWLRGRYEDEISKILLDVLREGDTFYDVGANIGYFSVLAARKVGP